MIAAMQYATQCKVAFGEKALATSVNKLVEELHLDPEITQIDALIVGPRDIAGKKGQELIEAIEDSHDDIKVIYTYTKDKEIHDFEREVFLYKEKRVTPDTVKEAVQETLDARGIKERNTTVISKDTMDIEELPKQSTKKSGFMGNFSSFLPKKKKKDVEEYEEYEEGEELDEEEVETHEEVEELPVELEKEEDNLLPEDDEVTPVLTVPEVVTTVAEIIQNTETMEERVRKMESIQDWDQFTQNLDRDKVVRELLRETSDFNGAVNMLDVLDKQIQSIYLDKSRTSEDKMREIRAIALQRSTYKDIENNVVTNKICTIMESMVTVAATVVDRRLDELKGNMDKIASKETYFGQRDKIQKLIEERLEVQVELHELTQGIINLYRTIDDTAIELIKNYDEGLPTGNGFLNEVMKPIKSIFTPKNSAKLANQLMADVSNHRLTLSAVETRISKIVELNFTLSNLDTEIIMQQDHLIRLLETQKVEEIVITDTLLKSSLNLYVGAPRTGLHATAITNSGILSRRRNTLVIDLTDNPKFGDYGMSSEKLEDLYNRRIEKQLLAIEGKLNDLTDVPEFVKRLTEMLDYYNTINVIITNDQVDLINELANSALTINYVMDSTKESIDSTRNLVESMKVENIARKVVMIDPTDVMWLLEQVSIDPLLTKVVNIPHMSAMRECALRRLQPFENTNIADTFETAFK